MSGSDVIGCFENIDGDDHIGIVFSSLSISNTFISGSTNAYYFDYVGGSYAKITCVGFNYDSATN